MLGAQLAATFHEGRRRAHEIHVARDWFDHQARQLGAMHAKGLFQLFNMVVLQNQRVLHHFGRHAGAGWVAKSRQARTRLDQKCVGMAVVAAFKLDQFAAPGGATRQTDGAHRGFGAGADQPHHVHAGHQFEDFFGQLDFALGWRAKREAVKRCVLHSAQHSRVTVTQNHGAPGADVVNIALAVRVPKVGALRAGDKTRRSTDCLEGPYRRVHAARDHAPRTLEKLVIEV